MTRARKSRTMKISHFPRSLKVSKRNLNNRLIQRKKPMNLAKELKKMRINHPSPINLKLKTLATSISLPKSINHLKLPRNQVKSQRKWKNLTQNQLKKVKNLRMRTSRIPTILWRSLSRASAKTTSVPSIVSTKRQLSMIWRVKSQRTKPSHKIPKSSLLTLIIRPNSQLKRLNQTNCSRITSQLISKASNPSARKKKTKSLIRESTS